jgi:hypothetical protein
LKETVREGERKCVRAAGGKLADFPNFGLTNRKSGLDIEGESSRSYIKHTNPLMQGFHVTTQHKLLADWGMR